MRRIANLLRVGAKALDEYAEVTDRFDASLGLLNEVECPHCGEIHGKRIAVVHSGPRDPKDIS